MPTATVRHTAWSRFSEVAEAVAFLNETVSAGKRVILNKVQCAIYVHVDDGVIFTSGEKSEEI